MSKGKQYFFQFLFVSLNLLILPGAVFAQQEGNEATLAAANKFFEDENYPRAQEMYEGLFRDNVFTERMLFRLAYIYENQENLPEAIYYLKKIKQEYGGADVDNKVKQLLQAQGAKQIYSASGWDSFIQFFASWAWLIWIAAALSAGFLVFHLLTLKRGLPSWRRLAFALALLPFIAAGSLLFVRGFMVPDRAVIVKPTSFYTFPSYAADNRPGALPVGETVNITSKSDIWLEVEIGEETWWVPYWSVRRL